MTQDALLESFTKIPAGSTCYFQNNNMDWMDGHINCFKTSEQFIEFLNPRFDIVFVENISIEKPKYTGQRFSVKCIKK